ncbi:MAG TPA: hypothetical protein VFL42_06220 [Terriglobales bacterium]|nr:hypothetical protein [Terriglobales bacterium]
MNRLKLLLLLGTVIAVAATSPAWAQGDLDPYKTQEPEVKQEKPKDKKQAKDNKQAKNNNDEGRRKHWWSLPHFRHKKAESASDGRRKESKPSTKTVALKPVDKTSATRNQGNKTATVAKSAPKTHASSAKTATSASKKTASKSTQAAKPGTSSTRKTSATAAQKRNAAATSSSRKTVASTNHGKKAGKPDCSPEEAKKGGCEKASN